MYAAAGRGLGPHNSGPARPEPGRRGEDMRSTPVTAGRLRLAGGSDGILTPSRRSLCGRKHRAIVSMRAHSGKVKNTTIALSTPCPKGSRKRR
jgi:hypothetical protein